MLESNVVDKWPRDKALKVRDLVSSLDICFRWRAEPDGALACVLELLTEGENHTEKGFYRDKWFEFGAKCLDSFGLLEHGGSIGFAWLTDDGKLLLEFLRDFGLDWHDYNDGSGHPFWMIDCGWKAEHKDDDAYDEWKKAAVGERSNAGLIESNAKEI